MAIAANPLESFIWGAGGAKKTPEQVAREREIAQALMANGADFSPVDHWLQGAARAAQAGVGAFKDWRAGNAEEAGQSAFQSQWDSVFGGGSSPSGIPATGGGSAAVPATADAAAIREGLIARGLPEHVADGFLLNFQDESGLNPGINEAAPIVPGSRGGYGLYQLTGPRRVAYEQYAAQKGVDPSDVNAQLDFMMSELQGPEASAYQAIMAAPDTGSAAAAIVSEFLRPAKEHEARRIAQYTGGTGLQTGVMAPRQEMATVGRAVPRADGTMGGSVTQQPVGYSVYDPQPAQVASLDPAIGMPLQAQPEAALPPQQQIAQALTAPSQQAAMGGGGPTMEQLIGLASDPWANDSQRSIIQSLLGQQMQQQDPMYQLQMQQAQQGLTKGQLEIAQLLNPQQEAPKPIEVGGVLVDPVTYQPLFDSRQPQGADPTSAMQNYEYLVANGIPPEQALERAFSGGVNVNLGDQGPQMGTIPAGMTAVADPTNPSGFRLEAIPGGPAALEAAAAAANADARGAIQDTTGNIVAQDIDRALGLIDQPGLLPTTGFGADWLNGIGGTAGNDLRNLLNTVKANTAFDQLQQMRDASPTGGALGGVSAPELTLLESAKGALEQSQSPQQLKDNLIRVQNIYLDIVHGPGNGPERKRPSFEQAPASGPADIDALLEKYQ